MKKSKKIQKIIPVIITICIVILGVFLLFITMSGSEEYISNNETKKNFISVLDCSLDNPIRPFFMHNEEELSNHRVKIEFKDDFLNKADFTYTGFYQSTDAANKALSLLRADYNVYMGKIGVYQEDLYPTFSAIDSKAIINLFIPKKYFNTGIAKFVFLDDAELGDLDSLTIEEMQKIYENKDFSCKTITNTN